MGYSCNNCSTACRNWTTPARRFSIWTTPPGRGLGAGRTRLADQPDDALAAWLWSWLENQLAVLMKTLPLGQQAAQRLTSQLLPLLNKPSRTPATSNRTISGSAAFGLSLACMAHERQYSRLFRS